MWRGGSPALARKLNQNRSGRSAARVTQERQLHGLDPGRCGTDIPIPRIAFAAWPRLAQAAGARGLAAAVAAVSGGVLCVARARAEPARGGSTTDPPGYAGPSRWTPESSQIIREERE